jgi:hypothetical protein
MKREDAIARFGHHYTFSVHNRTVHESLGAAAYDDDDPVADPVKATEEMKDRLADAAMDRLADIDKILEKPMNRVMIFMAHRGWHKNTDLILRKEKSLLEEKKKLQHDLARDFDDCVTVKSLPDEIKIPVALEPGRQIHIVRASFMEEGIKTSTATITDRRIWGGSSARGDWDYIFSYTATDENGKTLSFEYNRADETNPKIDNNYHGTHYFLTREAAEDFTLALAAKLSAEFSRVAIDMRLRMIDRPRPPQGPSPAP